MKTGDIVKIKKRKRRRTTGIRRRPKPNRYRFKKFDGKIGLALGISKESAECFKVFLCGRILIIPNNNLEVKT